MNIPIETRKEMIVRLANRMRGSDGCASPEKVAELLIDVVYDNAAGIVSQDEDDD